MPNIATPGAVATAVVKELTTSLSELNDAQFDALYIAVVAEQRRRFDVFERRDPCDMSDEAIEGMSTEDLDAYLARNGMVPA